MAFYGLGSLSIGLEDALWKMAAQTGGQRETDIYPFKVILSSPPSLCSTSFLALAIRGKGGKQRKQRK